MKNTVFISTYFNNSHFVELQAKAYKQFVENDYDFVVLDDAEPSTRSILSNRLANEETKELCDKWGARYIQIPQSIHAYVSQGGYVPDENESTHHPTERHQACLRYLFKNYKSLGLDQYKFLVLTDADVMVKKKINMDQYMEFDIMGTGRQQQISLPLGRFPDARFPSRVKELNNTSIYFLTLYIFMVNLQKVSNLEDLDIGTWPGTDTGGKTIFFIRDNPQYVCSFLLEKSGKDRVDVIAKNIIFDEFSAEFVHYRLSSNWTYENPDYYRERLNRTLKRYIPEIMEDGVQIMHNLRSRDGEHILE